MKYVPQHRSGGCCSMNKQGCCKSYDNKLNTHDWLCDIPDAASLSPYVEVQFKNTRKGYYLNDTGLDINKGDVVAVEATPGHDVGTVTLTGKLAWMQMKKNRVRTEDNNLKRIYRIARPADIERQEEARSREHETMIRAREIAVELGLDMKIGDVEYQGDGNKAIFYYIADERVDFRQLIKVLAETFHVRIEMKQIGARQEAGRIGGIGPCGRELCCSSWMSSFVSVATDAARFQDISLNPQKLAGQCAKLKCCFNFEVDTYVEANKRLPSRKITLETEAGTYYHFKSDVLKRELTYSTDKAIVANPVTITAERAFEIIALNKKGAKPESLLPEDSRKQSNKREAHDILDDNLNRFDNVKKRKRKRPAAKKENAGEQEPAPQKKEQTDAGKRENRKADGNRRRPRNNDKPKQSPEPKS